MQTGDGSGQLSGRADGRSLLCIATWRSPRKLYGVGKLLDMNVISRLTSPVRHNKRRRRRQQDQFQTSTHTIAFTLNDSAPTSLSVLHSAFLQDANKFLCGLAAFNSKVDHWIIVKMED